MSHLEPDPRIFGTRGWACMCLLTSIETRILGALPSASLQLVGSSGTHRLCAASRHASVRSGMLRTPLLFIPPNRRGWPLQRRGWPLKLLQEPRQSRGWPLVLRCLRVFTATHALACPAALSRNTSTQCLTGAERVQASREDRTERHPMASPCWHPSQASHSSALPAAAYPSPAGASLQWRGRLRVALPVACSSCS